MSNTVRFGQHSFIRVYVFIFFLKAEQRPLSEKYVRNIIHTFIVYVYTLGT